MIQCSECEYFSRGPNGEMNFRCDPFGTIKEPECLVKWQMLRLTEVSQKIDRMVSAYEATLAMYKRIQPLQEKMFRQMEHEIDDVDEADAWKYAEEEDDEDEGDMDEPPRL